MLLWTIMANIGICGFSHLAEPPFNQLDWFILYPGILQCLNPFLYFWSGDPTLSAKTTRIGAVVSLTPPAQGLYLSSCSPWSASLLYLTWPLKAWLRRNLVWLPPTQSFCGQNISFTLQWLDASSLPPAFLEVLLWPDRFRQSLPGSFHYQPSQAGGQRFTGILGGRNDSRTKELRLEQTLGLFMETRIYTSLSQGFTSLLYVEYAHLV